jgi:hypothetical protein
MTSKIFAAAFTLAILVAGSSGRANAAIVFVYRPAPVYARVPAYQPVPVYQPAPVMVADADDRFAGTYDVQGVITSAVPYHFTVRVDDRFIPVLEHDGTIINPTGTTLAPSMLVNIAGWWDRYGIFHANRVNVVRF